MTNQSSSNTMNASAVTRNSPSALSPSPAAPITTTLDPLPNHPTVIRSFILHDVLLEKPIEKSFFELSKIFGNEKMSYSEFIYWHNKFSSGNFGMDDDRRPQFSTLPVHIVERVLEKLELKETMILRNVCKALRNLVDQRETFPCESIKIGCHTDYIRCRYNYRDVIYAPTAWKMPIDSYDWKYGHAKVIKSVDYEKLACDHLRYVLMKPKLRLSRLCIAPGSNSTEFSTFERFETLFRSIWRMVRAEKVTIEVYGPAITTSLLSMLEPETLHSIQLESFERPDAYDYEGWTPEKVTQLTSLNQWKQASELITTDPFDHFEPSHFTHFKELDFNIEDIDRETILTLRNMFSDPCSTLDSCYVKAAFELDTSLFLDSDVFVTQRDLVLGIPTYHSFFPGVDSYYLVFHHLPHNAITIRKQLRNVDPI